ncbi:methylenetetrahydrofolate reductase C-terminal domain-containing protein [Thiovibrio frasassiensis]|uniref:Methylenetetrahydrofolate reductase n=1 Tax=Thiovibrio frasassiensis TaxID=2984131 RepID=A0A9X4RPB9_9BACT|nr:methylenetetrahydrofolate reductase C-terminal domain-containing protein [Thiovibrio frasassiensis]MDG4475087.1 methylenetetrahydrofolate reductase C-terminal domain-containing protein [Thiovibrio frasassiensis]
MLAEKQSPFRQSLFAPEQFTITLELVPSRGGHSRAHERTLELAEKLACDPRIQAVSITENAGGQAALSPEVLGLEIQKMGLDVIVHFSSKDKNRNQMESLLFAWDRLGIRDLLVITGDYPQEGYQGFPKPVFDLGSVHVLDLISRMNRGNYGPERGRGPIRPTSFLMGVALSPFKRLESELLMQYAKLQRKAERGADYIITQVGYDARKFHEVIQYVRQHGLNLPVLGNVFIPNLTVATLMHTGKIPGCIITDALYAQIRSEAASPDKGKQARLLRGAKLLAILKGLGYAGAHLGGPGLSYADIDFLLASADSFAGNWQELVPEMHFWHQDGFYLYRDEAKTGLNSSEPAPCGEKSPGLQLNYRMAQLVHNLAFTPEAPLYPLGKKICLALEGGGLDNSLTHLEHVTKFLLFGCQNCGDCTLGDLAFVCPQSGCAKYLLNGPCGGSRDGWCEVYPGKKPCLYVRIYERLAAHGLPESMGQGFVPPRNWALNNTSSWLNFFRGLDHAAGDRSPGHGTGEKKESSSGS